MANDNQYYIANTPGPAEQFFNDNGDILSGGKIYIYYSGTSTLAPLFSDNKGTVLSNPIITDSAGRCSVVWFSDIRYCDMFIYNKDNKLIKEYRGSVFGIPFKEEISGIKDVRRFGATGNGIVDDFPFIQAALDSLDHSSGDSLGFYGGVYITSSTLTVTSKRNINLFGFQATLKRPDNQDPKDKIPLIKFTNVERVNWDNLHTDGNRIKNRTQSLLVCPNIELQNVKRFDIKKSDVKNHIGNGILISGDTDGSTKYYSSDINIDAHFEGGNLDCVNIKGARNVHMDITASNVNGYLVNVNKDNQDIISRDIYLDNYHAEKVDGIGSFASMGGSKSENMFVGRGRIHDSNPINKNDFGLIFVSECDLTVEGARFSNCEGAGSAIYTEKQRDIRVRDCSFEYNKLNHGNLYMDAPNDEVTTGDTTKAWILFNRSIGCEAMLGEEVRNLWNLSVCSPFQMGNITEGIEGRKSLGTVWFHTNYGIHFGNEYYQLLRTCMEEDKFLDQYNQPVWGASSVSMANHYLKTKKTGSDKGIVNLKHDELMGVDFCSAFNFSSLESGSKVENLVPFGHNGKVRSFIGNGSHNFYKQKWKARGLPEAATALDRALAEFTGLESYYQKTDKLWKPTTSYILCAVQLPYVGVR